MWGSWWLIRAGQDVFRRIKNQGAPPPPTKMTIAGENEIYIRENLIGPFLVHKLLGPKPRPPLQPPPPPPLKRRPGAGACSP